MNRLNYFDYIEEKINLLATRIEARGRLNLLNLNIISEHFYCDFLNLLYGWELKNLNEFEPNAEGIDLVDEKNMLVAQVSATNTKQKLEKSLNKNKLKDYKAYSFKFICIAKDADNLLKNTSYQNPYNIKFNPSGDIIDKNRILTKLKSLAPDKLKGIYNFIYKEFNQEIDIVKIDSNLVVIIDVLSQEDLTTPQKDNNINSFEVDRKITFNNLNIAKMIIDDYSMYYSQLNKKYEEFDKLGVNKSFAVLQTIRKSYMEEAIKSSDNDIIFMNIIDNVRNKVLNSTTCQKIPADELEICASILVVDAFIKCKIFKNPQNYSYAFT